MTPEHFAERGYAAVEQAKRKQSESDYRGAAIARREAAAFYLDAAGASIGASRRERYLRHRDCCNALASLCFTKGGE